VVLVPARQSVVAVHEPGIGAPEQKKPVVAE
jgi:hypothetical protein